jgi:hypothetical protein
MIAVLKVGTIALATAGLFLNLQAPCYAQTLELRQSPVPAATVDDSGQKLHDDPLAAKAPPTVLTGVLTKQELQGRVNLNSDGKSLTLYLVNRGKRALVFAGDQAVVRNGRMEEPAQSQYEVKKPPMKSQVPKDVMEVAISLASAGAVPAIGDEITQYQEDGTPYYGRDQQRRKLAERRFGQRTLFPGESTTGKVYLPFSVSIPSELSLPVTVHPSGEAVGSLVLPINPEN